MGMALGRKVVIALNPNRTPADVRQALTQKAA